MHTYENTHTPEKSRILSLYHLVADLLDSYGQVQKEHSRYFINDVPGTMVVNAALIGPLLGDLFSIISSNPGKAPVHISATEVGHSIKLFVKQVTYPLYCFNGSMAA